MSVSASRGPAEETPMSGFAPAEHCRGCGGPLETDLIDLGAMPLANRLLDPDDPRPEPRYPLRVQVCGRCFLAQLDGTVPPEELFSDYVYFSSTSRAWVEHAGRFVDDAAARFGLGPDSLVVEIASNDGYLLRHVVARGIPALGIEPAANVAEAARRQGIPTESRFFSLATARDLAGQGRRAAMIVANNVLAHAPVLPDFLAGVALLLRPDGVFTAEFPHLRELIAHRQFDTIYHEHVFYLSLLALEPMLDAAGLRLFDVEQWPTHGGSLRIFAARAERPRPESDRLAALRALERQAGLDRLATYAAFGRHIAPIRRSLTGFLASARAEAKRVMAFGAAAKGITLLNYCGVTTREIAAVIDETPAKIGKLIPGCRIPILGLDRLAAERPDYVLILPWNHKTEIATKLARLPGWNARLVLPVPRTEVLAAA